MRIVAFLGPRSLFFAALAASVVGCFAALMLAPTPRVSIPVNGWNGRLAFSSDCRYLAFAHGKPTDKRHWDGELSVWDTQGPERLFTLPYSESYPPTLDGGYTFAFLPKGDKLVAFSWGKPKYFSMPSGEHWEPPIQREFPHARRGSIASQLVSDAQGQPFVFVQDTDTRMHSIYDLHDGQQISSWKSNFGIAQLFAGGIVEMPGLGHHLREIPSSKPRERLSARIALGGSFTSVYYTGTPDCRTLVAIDGVIRKSTDGVETECSLPAHQFPAISPDGRLLAALVRQGHSYDWRTKFWSKIGIAPRDFVFVVYDLDASTELVRFPHGTHAHFSLDGNTFVLFTQDAFEFYDVPIGKPWSRIALVACIGACVVYLGCLWIRYRRKRRVAKLPEPTCPTSPPTP